MHVVLKACSAAYLCEVMSCADAVVSAAAADSTVSSETCGKQRAVVAFIDRPTHQSQSP